MSVQFETEDQRVETEPRERSAAKETAEETQELKITVRKLEVPVRPRGVLAE